MLEVGLSKLCLFDSTIFEKGFYFFDYGNH